MNTEKELRKLLENVFGIGKFGETSRLIDRLKVECREQGLREADGLLLIELDKWGESCALSGLRKAILAAIDNLTQRNPTILRTNNERKQNENRP